MLLRKKYNQDIGIQIFRYTFVQEYWMTKYLILFWQDGSHFSREKSLQQSLETNVSDQAQDWNKFQSSVKIFL